MMEKKKKLNLKETIIFPESLIVKIPSLDKFNLYESNLFL